MIHEQGSSVSVRSDGDRILTRTNCNKNEDATNVTAQTFEMRTDSETKIGYTYLHSDKRNGPHLRKFATWEDATIIVPRVSSASTA